MSLDATVYANDDCDTAIASIRIGNLDGVVQLRKFIKEKFPEASVLLTKVLYSATHCGDSLQKEDILRAKIELATLSGRCPDDELVQEFVTSFSSLAAIASLHDQPITFT
jgi:hypothetical protein